MPPCCHPARFFTNIREQDTVMLSTGTASATSAAAAATAAGNQATSAATAAAAAGQVRQ